VFCFRGLKENEPLAAILAAAAELTRAIEEESGHTGSEAATLDSHEVHAGVVLSPFVFTEAADVTQALEHIAEETTLANVEPELHQGAATPHATLQVIVHQAPAVSEVMHNDPQSGMLTDLILVCFFSLFTSSPPHFSHDERVFGCI
jgi:hypothetical protein